MQRNTITSGLIGIICGIGAHADVPSRESWAAQNADPQWAMEQCYKASMAAAVNILDLRSLGRDEARQTGTSLSGTAISVGDVYSLRTLGRPEPHRSGRDMGVQEDEMRKPARVATPEMNTFYRLRSLGREEAHQTGVDVCKRIGAEDDRRAEYQ